MSVYLGDFELGATFDFKFTTVGTDGAPATLSGTPAVVIYEDNSITEITAAETLTVDFDGVTGLNNVRVVATSGNGFQAGSNFQAVISAGTVGGTSVVGYVVAQFSIEDRSALRPTTAGNTLDVSAGGEAGIDWANVGTPGSTVSLSATTVNLVTTTTTATTATNLTTNNDKTGYSIADATSDAVIADAVWNAATVTYGTAGSYGLLIETDLDATISSRSSHSAADVWAVGTRDITGGTIDTVGDKTGYSIADATSDAVIADAVWNAATVTYGIAGSYGLLIETNVDATISSRSSHAATDIVSAGAITTLSGAVVNVDTVDVTTTNSDMRGTENALLAASAPANFGDLAITLTTGQVTVGTNADKTDYTVATGGIVAGSFAAGAIDAAAIAANAIGSSELAQSAAQEVADEVLNRNIAGGGSGGARIVRDALRVLRNRVAVAAGTMTVYQENDTTAAFTAVVSTTAGNPISEIDPA
jgi:hypothetical protein